MLSMEKHEAERGSDPRLYHEVEAELGFGSQLEICLPRSQAIVWQAQVC